MAHGRPDFTSISLINGTDALGNLVTIAVDASGNIVGVMKGAYSGDLKTLATDIDGRILARLMGRYGDTMIDVSVDEGGKLAITEISQSNISADSTEAQGWTTPIANLLSNMNRIRYAIISMSGEAWGTFSHSIASTWEQIATAIGIHAALPDVHHAQSHTLASHSTKAHSELTSVGANDHHAQKHASQHLSGGDDLLGWTDEKLLKGAGAGVAPDEIDIPSGGLGIFGDGNDGDVTISANTPLTRDMFYDDLTVNAGITLDTAGYRIFVKGTLTNNGTIERTPNNGANATATALGIGGATLIAKSLGAGGGTRGDGGQTVTANSSHGGGGGSGGGVVLIVAETIINSSGIIRANGGNGGNGNGVGGAASSLDAIGGGVVAYSLGGAGGKGGDSNVNTGPAGGTASAPAATEAGYRTLPFAIILRLLSSVTQISGGGNGGGGARSSGGASASGGGGGGGGGLLVLIYYSLTTGTEQASGGTGGAAYGTGTAGTNGSNGTIIKIQN